MSEARYVVDVKRVEKALKIPQEVLDEIKGAVGSKMISSMRREVVSCPIRGEDTPFLVCFSCSNFIRRVSGKVYCRGLPLS